MDPPGRSKRLLDAGADLLRVNLSHAPPRAHAERVKRARAHKPGVAILADLGGPKLRLGDLAEEIPVEAGQTVIIGAGGVPVADPTVFERVSPGDPVYIADGTIHLQATAVDPGRITCQVVVGGILRSRKGINLPADQSSSPCLTDKDRADLAEIDFIAPDFVALSYVRTEADILVLQRALRAAGGGQDRKAAGARSHRAPSCRWPTRSWWRAAIWGSRCRSSGCRPRRSG